MLNIRFSRVGKRNHAQYKLVVAEKTAPIKGKFVEQLGSYDPHTKEFVVKEDRVKHWISQGAGCSRTVHNLLVKKGIVEGEKIKLTFKPKKSEEGMEEVEEKVSDKKQEENTEGNGNNNEKTEEEKNEEASEENDVKKESAEKETKEK